MMGVAVPRRTRRLGAGSPVVQAAGSTLLQISPMTGPAYPFVAAAGLALEVVGAFFGGGCGNKCKVDTANTEAAQIGFNSVWYIVSGEDLGGVTGAQGCVCTPGQCGKQHCAIFAPQGSAYPNVPGGALGDPNVDIDAAIAQTTQIYQAGRAKLVRSESFADYDNNYQAALGRLNAVKAARVADAAANPLSAQNLLSSATSGASSLFQSPTAWLLIGGGLLAAVAIEA